MKGLRKILSLAVALCTVASSLPVYAGQNLHNIEKNHVIARKAHSGLQ